MQLRILHKGLIFLLVPLLLQIFCIFQLFNLLNKIETLSLNEARMAQIMDIENEIILRFAEGWSRVLSQYNSGAGQGDFPEQYRADIFQLLNSAKKLLTDSDEDRQTFAETERFTQREYELMKTFWSRTSLKGGAPSEFDLIVQLKPALPKLQQQVREQKFVRERVQKMRERIRIAREKESEARAELKAQIAVGIAADLALTIALLMLFLRDITRRLKIVVDNAQLIPTGMPLTQEVTGTDELAYLDQVLHSAANQLHEAAEHKAMITEMVAHDLRGPLTSAKLMVNRLMGQTDTSGDGITILKRLNQTTSQLIRLVEDLLTVDKLEAGKLELKIDALDLQKLVAEVTDTLSGMLEEKQIQIVSNLNTRTVMADPFRLNQVLSNLLCNAIKFSPAHSSIMLTVEEKGAEVLFSVRDFGPGVPVADEEQVFEKFYKAKESSSNSGFGLGLAISKLIVTEHGGKIGVYGPGSGSVFWFTLPKCDEDQG